MRAEYKFGLLGAILGPATGVTLMALPALISLSPELAKICVYGGAALTIIILCAAFLVARRGSQVEVPDPGHKQSMAGSPGGLQVQARDHVSVNFHNTPAQTPEAKSLPVERVPLVDFREWAAAKGWNNDVRTTDDGNNPWVFVGRLRQAAVDSRVDFWGRKYVYDMPEDLSLSQPLVKIPREHFEEYSLDPGQVAGANSNFDIFTVKLAAYRHEGKGKTYRDLYIDPTQGRAWLDGEGTPAMSAPQPPPPIEWLRPRQAIAKFVPSDLLDAQDQAREASRSADAREVDTYNELKLKERRLLWGKNALTMEEPAELVELRNMLRKQQTESIAAETKKRQSQLSVLDDLHDQLRRGELIAQGHLSPVETPQPAAKIDRSLWSFLRLDVTSGKAGGDHIEYIGIEIAAPPG